MKTKGIGPELAKAINRQAHLLAQQSFANIRYALERQARELLKAGKTPDEAMAVVQAAGLTDGR